MVLHPGTLDIFLYSFTLFCVFTNINGDFQDQTTSRANTLLDDADDIQRQLDNEARDRMKYGRPKTVWVLHMPTQFPILRVGALMRPQKHFGLIRKRETKDPVTLSIDSPEQWDYKEQGKWSKLFPSCGGRSQSPVDIPPGSLTKARGAHDLRFENYDTKPSSLVVQNDGKRIILVGNWGPKQEANMPLVYGGAVYSRRYMFHSLTLHWPSEHAVGGLQYPIETQALHISTDYNTFEDAVNASARDPQAFLGIANLYMYSNQSQKGLDDILKVALNMAEGGTTTLDPVPLSHFNPPLKKYACYQGSLTAPPCTESVLWMVRDRTLPVKRATVDAVYGIFGKTGVGSFPFRSINPLNDRKIYYFG